MAEELKKSYNPFKMWGSWMGLIIVFMLIPMSNFQNDWSEVERAWDRYNLCIQCGEPRNLTCVIKLCELEGNKIGIPCSNHPDIQNNRQEAFINGFCGYNLWSGFDYGKKPNKVLTYFSLHNIEESFSGMTIFDPIFKFLKLILGFSSGWGIHSLIRKYKKNNYISK